MLIVFNSVRYLVYVLNRTETFKLVVKLNGIGKYSELGVYFAFYFSTGIKI